ncbi:MULTISPECIES: lantibiotic dehydratase [unclassified Streptomyces]|uniref:lantibiotic dehydratase n=1 Tax=unclassified Streptomyces TaxID=2593676 RepID=UPI000DC3C2E9|nr:MULTISPECIES: lantibiotic dehydratase [unclassified Streptomyces]MYT71545.1 lantibiotic dehydratase [Streptomyces sp. SID8367]RAJ83008.1 thiopeptide-type bacteriocin biosynthesis protein [Streptomyces sp. PsTaAH-137]
MTTRPIYRRHGDALVLRAAALPVRRPVDWPDVSSQEECRRWLAHVWADDALVAALRAASPRLSVFVERIVGREGSPGPKRVTAATLSVASYLLRAASRPTPFGLFAGVALAECGPIAAEFGTDHQPVARPDTLWVDHVRRDLQARPDVLPVLSLQVNTLAFRRGDSIGSPRAGGRLAAAPINRPLARLLDAAAEPIAGHDLLHVLEEAGGTPEQARRLVVQALEEEYLTSSLEAPMTVPYPVGHILRTLLPHEDVLKPETVEILDQLGMIALHLALHNEAAGCTELHRHRETTDARMRALQPADCRSRISLDLRLDARVSVPREVLAEVERAADALVRLTRTRGDSPAWAAYQTHFWERYGAGVLVPVRDAVDLATGVGLPADYPMSVWTEVPLKVLPRDEQLAARAQQAVMKGERELVLTDSDIDELAGDDGQGPTAPHVEIGFRIRAVSQRAVSRGDFTLDVRPAWTTGALSGRFAAVLGSRLSDPYRTLPTMTEGALSAQLSFMPCFPHSQNVGRIPALLPYVIAVGETRDGGEELIGIDDLAVFSTGKALHLVSMERRRVVEPHVFHPLALEKQAPPLARFLAMLGRGFATAWTAFDWGPAAAGLPYLPRVRYRRSILAPARWKLPAATLPSGAFGPGWHKALNDWATEWRCPPRLDLVDDDRTVTVDLAEPLHARLVHHHLRRHKSALFQETASDEDLGWIGRAHEITVPLASTRPQAPHPDLSHAPVVTNETLAHPGDGEQPWVQAKVFTHPTAMDEIITRRMPHLLEQLGTTRVWFVRYRSLQETDHLRLRVPTGGPEGYADTLRTLSHWTRQLTADRLASQLVLDGYRPETGRYSSMEAAEDVFVADSLVSSRILTDVHGLERETACAFGMIDLAQGFLGNREGLTWMAEVRAGGKGHHAITRQALEQAEADLLYNASPHMAQALLRRRAALGTYRALVEDSRLDQVLESLLHMHHNRLMGPDRISEAASRHAARQTCRSLVMRRPA